MHPKRIALAALAALIAALAFAAPAGATADVYGQAVTGRVFYLHGLRGHRNWVEDFPVLFHGMVAQGWQVVVPDEPYDQEPDQGTALQQAFSQDQTGGQTYRTAWGRNVSALIDWANANLGLAPKTVIGGVSWGGLHSLLGACSDTRISGYFATIPVVDPTALTEFQGMDLSNLTPYSGGCQDRLAQRPGYISYGGADDRVGTTAVRHLVGLLDAQGAPLEDREWPGMGHDVPADSQADILRWLAGTFPRPTAQPAASAPAAPASVPATAPAAAPAVHPVVSKRCVRARGCRNIVRRGKLYHVYRYGTRHPRWVYVRRASR